MIVLTLVLAIGVGISLGVLGGGVTLLAVVGSVLGGRLTDRIPEARLRAGFGWFVAVMAVVMLVQEVGRLVG